MKRIFLFFLFFISFHQESFSKENRVENSSNTSYKKYNLSICSIFKDEAKNLRSWIDYHRNFGIDHFYLYNIGSRDSFQAVLNPYIREGVVTLINWPAIINQPGNTPFYTWALSTQVPAYENAVNFIAIRDTKWLVLLNVNEFLICPQGNIKDLLNKYDEYPGIAFSANFDPVQTASKKSLIIRALTMENPVDLNKSVTPMIFKPSLCEGFFWPPYRCRFKQMKSAVEVGPQELLITDDLNAISIR